MGPDKSSTTYLEFEDNNLLLELFGSHETHLKLLEKELEIRITAKGNQLVIQGIDENTHIAGRTLAFLYTQLQEGKQVDETDVMATLNKVKDKEPHEEVFLTTKRRVISELSLNFRIKRKNVCRAVLCAKGFIEILDVTVIR